MASGANKVCLWCGKKLYFKTHTKYEDTDQWKPPLRCYDCTRELYAEAPKRKFEATEEPHVFRCTECGEESTGDKVRRVVSRKRLYEGRGPYGDGYFCSLRCGHSFGEACADAGMRMQKKGK